MIKCQILKNVLTAIKEHTFQLNICGHIKLCITASTHISAAGIVCRSTEKEMVCKYAKEGMRR